MAKFIVQDEGRGDEPFIVYEVSDDGDVVNTHGTFADSKEAENVRSTLEKAAPAPEVAPPTGPPSEEIV